MPNITIKVTDALYQHARSAAASRSMTVSGLLRAFLLHIDQQAPAESKDELQAFSQTFPPAPATDLTSEIERFRKHRLSRLEEEVRDYDASTMLAALRRRQRGTQHFSSTAQNL
jgi:hypothetical protein